MLPTLITRLHRTLTVALAGALGTTLPPSQASPLFDEIGLTALQAELGTATPSGQGISILMVEASETGSDDRYTPNLADPQLTTKTITDLTGTGVTPSGHSTNVARLLLGTTSGVAPGATDLSIRLSTDFVDRLLNGGRNPSTVGQRIMNHSWIGATSSDSSDADLLMRFDHTISRDGVFAAVALKNGSSTAIPKLFAPAFNALTVGLSSGAHSSGTTSNPLYAPGRTGAQIVVPETTTSWAAPRVSAAAALLLETIDLSPSLANADSPDALRAILMAGASKAALPSWSNSPTSPLDATYGAGQLDVFNSYHILAAGQQSGDVDLYGWDRRASPAPGTSSAYNFTLLPGQSLVELSLILTWDVAITDTQAGPNFFPSWTLADLDLNLLDADGQILASSHSKIENIEHLYLTDLESGSYSFHVNNVNSISTSYSIAWRATVVPEPSSALLLTLTLALALLSRRSRQP
jgi:hypothetical protein